MYRKTTRDISVQVQPQYLEDESDPLVSRYVWAYHVLIVNSSDVAVQLTARTWNIIDGNGQTKKIMGDGVVGETPHLEPGDSFEYTSAVPLETSSGIMMGYYHMVSEFDEAFEVIIPTFSLDSPSATNSIH